MKHKLRGAWTALRVFQAAALLVFGLGLPAGAQNLGQEGGRVGPAVDFRAGRPARTEPAGDSDKTLTGYGWLVGWTRGPQGQTLWGVLVPGPEGRRANPWIEAWVEASDYSLMPGQSGLIAAELRWDPDNRQILRVRRNLVRGVLAEQIQGRWRSAGRRLNNDPVLSRDEETLYLAWDFYQPGFEAGDPVGLMALGPQGLRWLTPAPFSRAAHFALALSGGAVFVGSWGLPLSQGAAYDAADGRRLGGGWILGPHWPLPPSGRFQWFRHQAFLPQPVQWIRLMNLNVLHPGPHLKSAAGTDWTDLAQKRWQALVSDLYEFDPHLGEERLIESIGVVFPPAQAAN